MKGIETGKEKVKKICEALRQDTLEPAIQEAAEIIERARQEAARIVEQGRKDAESLLKEAKAEIEREQTIFQSALSQASKQAVQYLKQAIEEKLFSRELSALLAKSLQAPKVLAELITAVVKALEKDGLSADFSVYIPSAVPAREVNALLAKEVVDKLKEKSVLLAPIGGGIEVKLHKGNITLDLSDATLKELIANYIRKDFREIFFAAPGG